MMPTVNPTLNRLSTIELTPISRSAAISASGNGDQTRPECNSRGITVGINVTAVTGSIVVTIQGKDPASGTYYTLLASAAIAAPAFSTLTLLSRRRCDNEHERQWISPRASFRIAYTIVDHWQFRHPCTLISPVMLP